MEAAKPRKSTAVLRPHTTEDPEQLNAAAEAFYYGRIGRPTLKGVSLVKGGF